MDLSNGSILRQGTGSSRTCTRGQMFFCHASGLTRPLKDRPPREGDEVLAVREGIKGPEAWEVTPVSSTSSPPTTRHRTPRKKPVEEDIQAKIYACIFTAKALAGKDHRRLQGLIPLLLQHNGLPAVHIPLRALTANTSANTRLSLRGHPGNTGKTEVETVAAPNYQQEEAAPAGDEPKNREETETQDDVAGGEEETEDEDDEDEDEEVDVLGSGSEGEAPSPQPRKPNPPSDPQPPSGNQEDNDGWVTKNKRRRRKPFLRLVLPKYYVAWVSTGVASSRVAGVDTWLGPICDYCDNLFGCPWWVVTQTL
ncbi:hypothetical protein E2C01_048679 [Portunus trituberculatus]|uniref:Uncharacterized protein n=1 Tax=Portunus trituberculatus TaxID=210409 RepID=A0A5B7GE27_PORTR|nr:hypothetical protein [Portunus trituberculatus]